MKFICALFLTLLCMQTVNAQPIITRDPEDIWAIQWSPDASKLAIGYYNGHFQVIDANDMSILFENLIPDSTIIKFSWNLSNTKLAIGYYEDRIDIWDITNFSLINTIIVGISGVGDMVWSNDDNFLFVGTGNTDGPAIRKFDLNTGTSYTFIDRGLINGLTFFENNSRMITFGYNQVIFINVNDLTVYDFFATYDRAIIPRGDPLPRITSIDLHSNQEIFAIGYTNYKVEIWGVETKQLVTTLDAGFPSFDLYGVTDLAFNEMGSRLFAVTYEGTIHSWDTSTWQLIEQTEIDAMIINADFSPDGRYLAYGDLEQDSQIFIRDGCDFVAPDSASLENILPQANNFNEEAQICLTENGQYDLTALLPTITGDITIIGNGARIAMIGEGQIFTVGEFGNLTLKNITVGGE